MPATLAERALQIVSRGDAVDPHIATQRPASFDRGLDRFPFSFARLIQVGDSIAITIQSENLTQRREAQRKKDKIQIFLHFSAPLRLREIIVGTNKRDRSELN